MIGLLILVSVGASPTFSQSRDYPRNGNFDSRNLDRSIRDLEANSRTFVRLLDRELDRSRYNGSRLEDEINSKASRFRVAVVRFERAYMSGANERKLLYYAERMLNQGADLNRMLRRADISRTVDREWERIHDDLVAIARWHRARGKNSNW